MKNPQQNAIDKLNHIFALTADGHLGYGNAAKHVSHAMIATTLHRLAEQRATYGSRLQQEVLVLGGTADHRESDTLGSLQRTWMNLESVFRSGSTAAILEACITGETAALKEYDSVLAEPYIVGDVYQILSLQEQEIHRATQTVTSHLAALTSHDVSTRNAATKTKTRRRHGRSLRAMHAPTLEMRADDQP